MAGLTRDVELGPRGLIAILVLPVALLQIGRVAPCTHEVPVLIGGRPMKAVSGRNMLIRVQVEPTLAALPHGA